MPVDELIDLPVGAALRGIGAGVELVAQFAFNGLAQRYFHGIGRRVIAIATLGRKRIPTSLRRVPRGTKPMPRRSDWIALWTGLAVWLAVIATVAWAVFA